MHTQERCRLGRCQIFAFDRGSHKKTLVGSHLQTRVGIALLSVCVHSVFTLFTLFTLAGSRVLSFGSTRDP
jgi:hypothetical protein